MEPSVPNPSSQSLGIYSVPFQSVSQWPSMAPSTQSPPLRKIAFTLSYSPTGTGFLSGSFLSTKVPPEERIITIEDSAELQIGQIPNLVRLETRNANAEGEGAVEISDLIRAALRMRPDRIIVGEVRGKEALDMLQALNTGHDGSMSTGHANSARDMLTRLENMILMGMDIPLEAIRKQIVSGIDIIVHLGRLRDGSRKVLEVSELVDCGRGQIRLNPLYVFEETGESPESRVLGALVRKGELLRVHKLKAAGL